MNKINFLKELHSQAEQKLVNCIIANNKELIAFYTGKAKAYKEALDLIDNIECPVCKDLFHNEEDQEYINNNGLCINCDNKSQEMYAA